MRMFSEVFRIAHALRRPNTVLAALEALRSHTGKAKVDGLIELLHQPPNARAAVLAIELLRECPDEIVADALADALRSPQATVRLAAVEALQCRQVGLHDRLPALQTLLLSDESWVVRRAAMTAITASPSRQMTLLLPAATDPHWRVRHAMIQVLLEWGQSDAERREIHEQLGRLANTPRLQGVRDYLHFRWTGEVVDRRPMTDADDPTRAVPFWDWDVAVLLRRLERMDDAARRDALDVMPFLLSHADERIRSIALDTLKTRGKPKDIAAAIAMLDEPRLGTVEPVEKLIAFLDLDRREAAGKYIVAMKEPSPAQRAWAETQVKPRRAADANPPSEVSSDSATVPADDANPLVRATAMTLERAAELVKDPASETSWHVLAAAARMMKTPLWKLEPKEPWRPPASVSAAPAMLEPVRTLPSQSRLFGPAKFNVSAMGISGHYGLPVDGFVRAVESGINLFFWEPNYQTLTQFSGRLPPTERNSFHFIAGTFEADGARVTRDCERALRLLQIDRLSLFLIFWVQSWDRIGPDVREALERLKQSGKVAMYSLSTHNRPLAIEAIESDWNPVMVRHSVAHRGAEDRILPKAREKGTTIITFNNTCYGRLLRPVGAIPDAADCYRYTLAQPGVSVCLSAPATMEQLDENLQAFRDPVLPVERMGPLRSQGDRVYQEDAVFRKLVRTR
jgi:hypothetical protein